jgi:hypothetical protein
MTAVSGRQRTVPANLQAATGVAAALHDGRGLGGVPAIADGTGFYPIMGSLLPERIGSGESSFTNCRCCIIVTLLNQCGNPLGTAKHEGPQ